MKATKYVLMDKRTCSVARGNGLSFAFTTDLNKARFFDSSRAAKSAIHWAVKSYNDRNMKREDIVVVPVDCLIPDGRILDVVA